MIEPVVIEGSDGNPIGKIESGDAVIFFNHRGDRMRQLVRAATFLEFEIEAGTDKPKLDVYCLTDYDTDHDLTPGLTAAFPNRDEKNFLAEIFAQNSIRNCRLAEAERELYVTHYFDGCPEEKHLFAESLIVPSSSNAASPETPLAEITGWLLEKLDAGKTDVFVVNFASADIAAHTGSIGRTVKAIEDIDVNLGLIFGLIQQIGGTLLITSDHGNCEQMLNRETGETDRGHTANPVPFHLVDTGIHRWRLKDGGSLADVAPTVLALLDISKPSEMTGGDLRIAREAAIAA
jgi:2,3-bisphosphoglycerate-independent phosphoglycerate mutase